jgi:phosphatidylcholine synthase
MNEEQSGRLAAALVHVFTALGIVCALLATRATLADSYEQAFFWLGVAFFIDGVDGTFARRYKVLERLPRFSGETLDLVIDYVTYVFVPALMLLQSGVVSGVAGVALASLICMSSLYHFSDNGSKAEDHCFVGFPAIWNIVAFYVFALGLSPTAAAALILVCVVFTFVPTKWVHPMRVEALWPANAAAVVIWMVAAAVAVWEGFPASTWVKVVLIAVAIYGIGLSVLWGRAKLPTRWN